MFWSGNITYAASLEWNPNVEPEVSRYSVYWGLSSRAYDHSEDVIGRETTSFPLPPNKFYATVTYYFAVTAKTEDGLESDFSDEVYWTPWMKMQIVPGKVSANVKPGDNYLLEGLADISNGHQSWLGVEAKTAETSQIDFTVTFDEAHRFYRLKKLEAEPLIAMASAQKSMEKGLLLSVVEDPVTKVSKLKTKESLARKVKKFFKYNRRYEPVNKKGAELLMFGAKDQRFGVPPQMFGPPMPPTINLKGK